MGFEGSGGPIDFFPTVQGKNIDPVKLAFLEAIVAEQEQDLDIIIRMIGQPVRGDESSEKWINLFSEKLVTRLAELTAAEIGHYGAIWASIEEWRGPGAKPLTPKAAALHSVTITQYLQSLCQLASQAQAERKRMYLWICL